MRSPRYLKPTEYPIFKSVGAVPKGVFENPALVVERFLPEREGDLYVLYNYYFFGDRGVCYRRTGPGPIVKGYGTVSLEEVPVPREILQERARLDFDYGKFDFVMRDGTAWLLDANRTACYGLRGAHRDRQAYITKLLADGIGPWLEG